MSDDLHRVLSPATIRFCPLCAAPLGRAPVPPDQREQAVCSACGFVFIGATSREVAPDAALAVHNSRLILQFRGNPPPEVVAEERAVLENLTRNEGKPDQAIPKIVEGRMNGFFKEACLLEQPYVKDQKQTIRQLLGGADVTRFARLEIGK